jgi:DNA-binding NarL/FixJ family response regulator
MSVRIAVSDPLPLFRRGIMATLGDAGFEPEDPEDLLAWIRQEQRRVVVLTLQSPKDWTLLAQLHDDQADVLVVAVLADASVPAYVQAVLAGATAVLPREAPVDMVQRVFGAALRGESLLPAEVVRTLASPRPTAETGTGTGTPSVREIEWLRELASGGTVAQLAARAGYSERAMFRLLRDLYARLQVRNRTEAMMLARERGWL